MGAIDFNDLKRHIGHKIECVSYCDGENPEATMNVAIECETCNEVLLDYDKWRGGRMNKTDLIKYLKDNCTDFLNCEKGCEMPGYPDEKFTGFYIEVEDIADIMLKVKKWKHIIFG